MSTLTNPSWSITRTNSRRHEVSSWPPSTTLRRTRYPDPVLAPVGQLQDPDAEVSWACGPCRSRLGADELGLFCGPSDRTVLAVRPLGARRCRRPCAADAAWSAGVFALDPAAAGVDLVDGPCSSRRPPGAMTVWLVSRDAADVGPGRCGRAPAWPTELPSMTIASAWSERPVPSWSAVRSSRESTGSGRFVAGGSSASRRPSAKKLTPRATSTITIPGNVTSHHVDKHWRPVAISFPRPGSAAGRRAQERERRFEQDRGRDQQRHRDDDRPDRARQHVPEHDPQIPGAAAFAASTNSFSLSERKVPRTMRASVTQMRKAR